MIDDIVRDIREQRATKRYEEWLGSEEYSNSVQLKYEALLCDSELLNEAIGADGIQYPFSRAGLWPNFTWLTSLPVTIAPAVTRC